MIKNIELSNENNRKNVIVNMHIQKDLKLKNEDTQYSLNPLLEFNDYLIADNFYLNI